MSNNNEAAEEADNNNEREHRENNQNQNNPPEWGAFPDLLRVQEPQQNGGGPEAAGIMQRAGTSNPPDVSLPGAAGRDPPPPDFDLVNQSGNQNQRLPDMALDANQAQQHRSLPDMALDASGLPRERPAAASTCGGARFRPRRAPNAGGSPGSLAQMAQAAAGGSADNGIDPQSHQDPINARFHELEEQVQALRMHVYETDRMRSEEASRILDELASLRRSIDVTPRENPALENRLINIESLIQRMVAPRAEVSEEANRAFRARELQRQQRETERLSRLLAESLHLALTHFMQQLGNVDREENDDQPEP